MTRFELLGDSALTFRLAEEPSREMIERGARIADELRSRALPGVLDVWPAYASVTVAYDAARLSSYDRPVVEVLRTWIESVAASCAAGTLDAPRRIEIPVRYGGAAGADLNHVAERAGLTAARVVELHSSAEYYVGAVGFSPGFGFLLGLPEVLHTPRLETPRTRVPAGAVGIGGPQTGVYPLDSPGGWNLIGQTDLRLFDPAAQRPALLNVGDLVRFRAISSEATT